LNRAAPRRGKQKVSRCPVFCASYSWSQEVRFNRQVGADIHASQTALEIIAGLAPAGYAWGALLGGDLIQRFRQRELFFLCEFLFAIGCLLAAMARSPADYAAGRILSGFATGLLLVIALPPVFQRFPASKLPITIIFVNIGFFGAVCIGPLLGGWVEAGHHWRWFYGVLGAIGAANIIPAFLCIPLQPAFNPGLRFDWPAVLLGFGAVVLPFWASGELTGYGFASIRFTAPLFVGAICFVTLILIEFHQNEPLSPVKPMWNTYSVSGTLVAMIGGGVFVSMLELAVRFHMQVLHQTPVQTGLLLWPLAPAVLVTAMIFGGILRTRLMPLFLFMGMALLIGAGAMLLKLPANGGAGLT
jgi:MFS family permease